MAPSPVDSSEPNTRNPAADAGSIAGVAARLALWARRAPKGLARVEFDSDFSRQRVEKQLRRALDDARIPFYALELPQHTDAAQVVLWLKEQLGKVSHGVVSLTGWATAFPPDVPLIDSLRVLNYNRENLAQYSLCQVWWLPRILSGVFLREIPDLNSWFIVRLSLDESIVNRQAGFAFFEDKPPDLQNQTDARRRAADIVGRLDKTSLNEGEVYNLLGLAKAAVLILSDAGLREEACSLAALLMDKMRNKWRLRSHRPMGDDYTLNDPQTWETFTGYGSGLVSSILNGIGVLSQYAGDIVTAEAFYKAAVETPHMRYGANQIPISEARQRLSSLYLGRGQYDEAIKLFQDAIEETRKNKDINYLNIPFWLNNMAIIYARINNFAEAERLLHEAIAIEQKDMPVMRDMLEQSLSELALLYRSLGRYEEAERVEASIRTVVAIRVETGIL